MNSGNRNAEKAGKDAKLARLLKLQTDANKYVIAGTRDLDEYLKFHQRFVWGNSLPEIDWPETYRRLGMEREYEAALKTFVIPPENPQLWIVPMIQGVTCNRVVAAFRRDGVTVYTYRDDLDAGLEVHASRGAIKCPYVVGFSRTVEADNENKGKSANVLAEKSHKGITLPERLVLGYGYFVTTEQHLDVDNVTLCTGSRDSDGDVPRVYWDSDDRAVYVHAYSPDYALGPLRSRSAVSFADEALPSQQ